MTPVPIRFPRLCNMQFNPPFMKDIFMQRNISYDMPINISYDLWHANDVQFMPINISYDLWHANDVQFMPINISYDLWHADDAQLLKV